MVQPYSIQPVRQFSSAIALCGVLTGVFSPGATASSHATEPQPFYFYDGKRRSPLPVPEQGPGKTLLYRAERAGLTRLSDENYYVVYPTHWNEQACDRFEREQGLSPSAIPPQGAIRFYHAPSAQEALAQANRLVEQTPVAASAPLWIKRMERRSLAMDDPLFADQWHLRNTGQSYGVTGEDLNVTEVWQHYDGSGVILGIVDDGLELAHPDLAGNISSMRQYDYVENDSDPTAGSHGTSVAGVAAATAFNGIGGRGVAPGAQLVGLRLLDDTGFVDELAEAEVFRNRAQDIDIFNNSWGPPDNQNGAFTGPSPLARAAVEHAILHGRNGLGAIFVWAAGNGGSTDNSNLDGYANLRYTIAVSSTTNTGQLASYAEPGANILVNAPSSGGYAEITTTDRTGRSGDNPGGTVWDLHDPDYTAVFGGTSAATAMASGVIALILEANPRLNWREVQSVLALSARQNDSDHPSWRTNGAGLAVSHLYGFGRIDAAAAVETALAWDDPVTQEQASTPYFRNLRLPIPDNDPTGISDAIEVTENLRIEFVEVTVNIPDHTYWGDIDIRLVSPSGLEAPLASSRFLNPATPDIGYHMWTLGDVLHAGELSKGTWRLTVSDRAAEDVGTLFSWGLTIHGTPLPTETLALPAACSPRVFATNGLPPRPAGTIAAGVNRHGSEFTQSVRGTRHEDYMLVAGSKNTPPFAKAHAIALHEGEDGGAALYAKTDQGWVGWEGPVSTLPGFSPSPLAQEGGGVLFHGRLAPGQYTILNGYTTMNGDLLYCPEPLRITVE